MHKVSQSEGLHLSTTPTLLCCRLPTLPREEQKDDNQNKQEGKSQEPQGGGDGGNKKPDSKTKLLDQLRERRKEVERLMAKRRAEREGISVEVCCRFPASNPFTSAFDQPLLALFPTAQTLAKMTR